MRLKTARFGDIQVEPHRILWFEDGLYGFERMKRFVLVEMPRHGMFKWLQSVDDGDLAFVVMDPRCVMPDYNPPIPDKDMEKLGLTTVEKASLLAMVVIPRNVAESTVNLQAPLVVNPTNMLGRQVVIFAREYGLKYPLFRKCTKAFAHQGASLPTWHKEACASG